MQWPKVSTLGPLSCRKVALVTLDWNRIGSAFAELLVRPRDIFAALPSKPWSYLRQEQGEALEGWFIRRDDRDVVIKQNTGGGKTAVGLLIAQSTINERVGKAVYLVPDTYLAARVREEAARLGLVTADDPASHWPPSSRPGSRSRSSTSWSGGSRHP